MARLLVVQHHHAEGPGAIAAWAHSRGHPLTVVRPAEGDALPHHDDFDALVLLGGPWCAFADAAPRWLQAEKRWIADALRTDLPIFAVCLGAQLVAEQLGTTPRAMRTCTPGCTAASTAGRRRVDLPPAVQQDEIWLASPRRQSPTCDFVPFFQRSQVWTSVSGFPA